MGIISWFINQHSHHWGGVHPAGAHNNSDSEFMMGLLQSYGYSFVDTWQQADAVLVNSCTVKGPSQDSAVKLGSGDLWAYCGW